MNLIPSCIIYQILRSSEKNERRFVSVLRSFRFWLSTDFPPFIINHFSLLMIRFASSTLEKMPHRRYDVIKPLIGFQSTPNFSAGLRGNDFSSYFHTCVSKCLL